MTMALAGIGRWLLGLGLGLVVVGAALNVIAPGCATVLMLPGALVGIPLVLLAIRTRSGLVATIATSTMAVVILGGFFVGSAVRCAAPGGLEPQLISSSVGPMLVLASVTPSLLGSILKVFRR